MLRAGYVGLRSRPVVFTLWLGFFVIVPWLSALLFTVNSLLLGKPVESWLVMNLIAIPPLVVTLFGSIILFQFRNARTLQGTHTYNFSDADIHLKGPGFDNRVEWSILTRCHVSDLGWLITSGNTPLISIPGRLLTSSSYNEIQEMITRKGIKITGKLKTNTE